MYFYGNHSVDKVDKTYQTRSFVQNNRRQDIYIAKQLSRKRCVLILLDISISE